MELAAASNRFRSALERQDTPVCIAPSARLADAFTELALVI
jgi:hypothetical protein